MDAALVELADTSDSKSDEGNLVGVRFPQAAQESKKLQTTNPTHLRN